MQLQYTDHFTALTDILRHLYGRGLIAPGVGSVSVRLSDTEVLLSPLDVHPGGVRAEDLIETGLESEPVRLEHNLHLLLQRRGITPAVVSAPAPCLMAFSSLPGGQLEALLAGKCGIVRTGSAQAGEVELTPGDLLVTELGIAAFGDTASDCAGRLESAEHLCRIALCGHLLRLGLPGEVAAL